MRQLIIVLFLGTFVSVMAQEKIEQEYRIDASLVPPEAIAFVNAFEQTARIKWLQEESEEGTSIEAKFKSEGTRYSIEFSEKGMLEDVEVIIDFSEMPKEIKKRIQEYLDDAFTYYKVEKIQAQYTAPRERVLQWRGTEPKKRTLKPKYELVVKTRNRSEKASRFEFLFDEEGALIDKAKVIIRSDNILRF